MDQLCGIAFTDNDFASDKALFCMLLVWDKKMVQTQFNWCWCHVPTFAAYKVEGTFFPLILANGNTSQSAKTAVLVLQSLTPNAQSVFRVLAEYQLSHPDEEGRVSMPLLEHLLKVHFTSCRSYFPALELTMIHILHTGMPFDNLYTICRERFLASNQVTLNSHLTEFKDHELVKTRRHSDGQDCLYIPLTTEALGKLLLEIS